MEKGFNRNMKYLFYSPPKIEACKRYGISDVFAFLTVFFIYNFQWNLVVSTFLKQFVQRDTDAR
jgi:hypothetical protein